MAVRAEQRRKVHLIHESRELAQLRGPWTHRDDPFLVRIENPEPGSSTARIPLSPTHLLSREYISAPCSEHPDPRGRPEQQVPRTAPAFMRRSRQQGTNGGLNSPGRHERSPVGDGSSVASPGSKNPLLNSFGAGSLLTLEQLMNRTSVKPQPSRNFEHLNMKKDSRTIPRLNVKGAAKAMKGANHIAGAGEKPTGWQYRNFLQTDPTHRTAADGLLFLSYLAKLKGTFLRRFTDEQQRKLAFVMTHETVYAGRVLLRHGDPCGEKTYIILRGLVRVEPSGEELGPGRHFAEEALLGPAASLRVGTIVALVTTELAAISREDYVAVVMMEEQQLDLASKAQLLASVPVLSICSREYLLHLALMSEYVYKPAGDEICRQGGDVEHFFIVASGECLLESKHEFLSTQARSAEWQGGGDRGGHRRVFHIANSCLTTGQMIGDVELMNHISTGYLFTARALNPVFLLRFLRSTFQEQMTTTVFEAMRLFCHLRSKWRNGRMAVQLSVMARSGWAPSIEKFCYEPEMQLSTVKWLTKSLPAKFEYGTPVHHITGSSLGSDVIEPLSSPLVKELVPRVDLRRNLPRGTNVPTGVTEGTKWAMYGYGPWTVLHHRDAGEEILETIKKREVARVERRRYGMIEDDAAEGPGHLARRINLTSGHHNAVESPAPDQLCEPSFVTL